MEKIPIIIILILFLSSCSSNKEQESNRYFLPENDDKVLTGVASYYDYTIGDWSSIGHYVCATRDFIRYSFVEVTNLDNGKSVEVLITDYGPDESTYPDRIIDLSSTAFSTISDSKLGLANVSVKQLNKFR